MRGPGGDVLGGGGDGNGDALVGDVGGLHDPHDESLVGTFQPGADDEDTNLVRCSRSHAVTIRPGRHPPVSGVSAASVQVRG